MNIDEKDENQCEIEEILKNTGQSLKENIKILAKAQELMEFLEIPSTSIGLVKTVDLYNILTDEEKFAELICKLKNKAFW